MEGNQERMIFFGQLIFIELDEVVVYHVQERGGVEENIWSAPCKVSVRDQGRISWRDQESHEKMIKHRACIFSNQEKFSTVLDNE